MSARADQAAIVALTAVVEKREALAVATQEHADAYLRFLRDAQAAGWSWNRMGRNLGLTGRACEQYWKRNRLRAGRLGDAQAAGTPRTAVA